MFRDARYESPNWGKRGMGFVIGLRVKERRLDYRPDEALETGVWQTGIENWSELIAESIARSHEVWQADQAESDDK